MTENEKLIINLCKDCYELTTREDYYSNKKVFETYSQKFDAAHDMINGEPHSQKIIEDNLTPLEFNLIYLTIKQSC